MTASFQVTAAAFRGDGRPEQLAPAVPGFILSPFPPLVRDVVRRCLGDPAGFGEPLRGDDDAPGPRRGERLAILLGTVFGDSVTSDAIGERLAAGNVHNPLLFFQSVPTSVLGHLCREYAITGPVSCFSGRGATLAVDLLDAAGELLDQDEADEVLVIGIELAPNARTEQAARGAADPGQDHLPDTDTVTALLLRRQTGPADENPYRLDRSDLDLAGEPDGSGTRYGWQHALVRAVEGTAPAGGPPTGPDRQSTP